MNSVRVRQLVVLAAAAAVATFVVMHTYWDFVTVDNPPRGEAARNSYYSFEHLLGQFGIHTRQVPTLTTMPSQGGILLVNDLRGKLLQSRIDGLERWVEGGGRLLISRGALSSDAKLQTWSGVTLTHVDREQREARHTATAAEGPDAGCIPLKERVAGRETGQSFRTCIGHQLITFSSRRTPAWSLSDGYGFKMLRVDVGSGSVAVIDCDCMLGNRSLLRVEHARAVFAAVPLHPGDSLEILNPAQSEGLLTLLWRHGAAALLLMLAAVGLAIWRNWPRFGPLAPVLPPFRRSLAEQLRANARFAWRTRHLASLHRAARQALEGAARRRVSAYERWDAERRVAALASITGIDAAALRQALNEGGNGVPEAQRAAIALLETARRHLIHPTPSPQGPRA